MGLFPSKPSSLLGGLGGALLGLRFRGKLRSLIGLDFFSFFKKRGLGRPRDDYLNLRQITKPKKRSEGWQRAMLASVEGDYPTFARSPSAQLFTHDSGYNLIPLRKIPAMSHNDSVKHKCEPQLLERAYESLKEFLPKAQQQAQFLDPDRFLELQRADDKSTFLNVGGAAEKLSDAQVKHLGEALFAVQRAGAGLPNQAQLAQSIKAAQGLDGKKSIWSFLKKPKGNDGRNIVEVNALFRKADMANSISVAQEAMRDVAAEGFRCRATTFIWV